jgi:hypothetical protein
MDNELLISADWQWNLAFCIDRPSSFAIPGQLQKRRWAGILRPVEFWPPGR